MKSQIMGHLSTLAAHHTAVAKEHDAMAKECSGAAKQFHQNRADQELALGEHYVELAKAVRENFSLTNDDSDGTDDLKAAQPFGMAAAMRDFKKAAPTAAHAVLGDIPAGVRLVNRFGGAPIEDTAKVDPQFEDLVKT